MAIFDDRWSGLKCFKDLEEMVYFDGQHKDGPRR